MGEKKERETRESSLETQVDIRDGDVQTDRSIGLKEKELKGYETRSWEVKKKNGFDEVTEVSCVLPEHRYTPVADLFVS